MTVLGILAAVVASLGINSSFSYGLRNTHTAWNIRFASATMAAFRNVETLQELNLALGILRSTPECAHATLLIGDPPYAATLTPSGLVRAEKKALEMSSSPPAATPPTFTYLKNEPNFVANDTHLLIPIRLPRNPNATAPEAAWIWIERQEPEPGALTQTWASSVLAIMIGLVMLLVSLMLLLVRYFFVAPCQRAQVLLNRMADGKIFPGDPNFADDDFGRLARAAISMMASISALGLELTKSNHEVELARRARTDFLARLSHQVRSPLNSILGDSDLLTYAATNHENISDYALAIRRNAGQLSHILDNLVELSLGEYKCNKEGFTCSPTQTMVEVANQFQARALERSIHLTAASHGAVPASIRCNPTRLRQVLFHLVENALKFTEHGSISITCQVTEPIFSGVCIIHFAVTDTGCGIAPEKLINLQRNLVAADISLRVPGRGQELGLTITRKLCQLLGGELMIDSQEGKGTVANVQLLCDQPTDATADGNECSPSEWHRSAPSVGP